MGNTASGTTGVNKRNFTIGSVLAAGAAALLFLMAPLWSLATKGPATTANMPVPSSVEFLGWADQMRDQRLAAFPVSARTTTYYVSTSGNDANDGLTTATAWKTLQKVSDQIQGMTAPQALATAIKLRTGDEWHYDTSSYQTTYTSTISSGAGTNVVVLSAVPSVWSPQPGDHVQNINGGTRYGEARVVSWVAGTKTLTLDAVTNASATTIKVSCALLLNKPVYLTKYDDPASGAVNRALPQLSRFQTTLPSSWSNSADRADANTAVYSTSYTPTSSVARVKQKGTLHYVLRKVDSLADCQTYAGSWFWSSNVLYVHPHGFVLDASSRPMSNPKDQSNVRYEIAEKNFDTGICGSDVDGLVVDGVWVEGWGASPTVDTTYQGDGAWIANTGTNRAVVRNSVFSNNNRHSLVMGGYGSTSGGDSVVDNCRGEWCTEGLPFVAYSGQGGATCILSGFKSRNPCLPVATQAFANSSSSPNASSQLFYSHTSSTSYRQALMLAIDCEDEIGQWQCHQAGGWDYLPSWSDPKDARGFVINYKYQARRQTALDALGLSGTNNPSANNGALKSVTSGTGQLININSTFDARFVKLSSQAANGESQDYVWINDTANSVYLNCKFEFDFGSVQFSAARDNTRKRAAWDKNLCKFYNCLFKFTGQPMGSVGFSRRVMGAADPGEDTTIRDSVVWFDTDQNTSSNALYIGNGTNNAGSAITQLVNNAYINVGVKTGANGYDSDTNAVVDTEAPSDRPGKTSKLHVASSRSAGSFFGYDVQYDFLRRQRGTDGKRSIGPVEAWGAQ